MPLGRGATGPCVQSEHGLLLVEGLDLDVAIPDFAVVALEHEWTGIGDAAGQRAAGHLHERLVVVEDIPAFVCANCGERYYDDQTAIGLDLLRGTGFPAECARAVLQVEVFSFGDGPHARATS